MNHTYGTFQVFVPPLLQESGNLMNILFIFFGGVVITLISLVLLLYYRA